MKNKFLVVFVALVFFVSITPYVSAQSSEKVQVGKSSQSLDQRIFQPDLRVTGYDISFSSDSPKAGEIVTIEATIRNGGRTTAYNVLAEFYVGDPDSPGAALIGSDVISRIGFRRSEVASTAWTAMEGTHTIFVKVDPYDSIAESNEMNNKGSRTITVYAGIPTTPIHNVAITSVTSSPTEVTVGDVVTITIGAENLGTEVETFDVITYYDLIEIGTQRVQNLGAGAKTTLTFAWNTAGIETRTYTIKATATNIPEDDNPDDNTFVDGIVTVLSELPPAAAKYELVIEIDYMVGHAPTQDVLDYIEEYYIQREIRVTFRVDDMVPYDASVSDAEFWAIEAAYNDVEVYDDRGHGRSSNAVLFSKEKWVLFGSTVEGQPNVVGYTYVAVQRVNRSKYDLLAGNYIFIADDTGDKWAGNSGVSPYGAEAAVLMHELGHSVGIAILDWLGREVYCSDIFCVMAMLNVKNAGSYGNWHYCDDHWDTINMDYYKN